MLMAYLNTTMRNAFQQYDMKELSVNLITLCCTTTRQSEWQSNTVVDIHEIV